MRQPWTYSCVAGTIINRHAVRLIIVTQGQLYINGGHDNWRKRLRWALK